MWWRTLSKRPLNRRQFIALMRSLALPLGLLALLGAAWRWRVLQLTTFFVVSLVYRFVPTPAVAGPAAKVDEWAALSPPQTPPPPLGTRRGMVTYHPWYQGFHAGAVNACLAEVAALGAGYLRSDVRWADVLPDGLHPDEAALRWYRAYFVAARDWYGVRPLIVLSQPPAAVTRLDSRGDEFLARWEAYIDLVATRLGDLCELYQPMNEPNNPVYSFFPPDRQPAAIRVAAERIHAHAPTARVMINVLMDLWNWRDRVDALLQAAGEHIDIIGIDHYPGTWTFSDGADWDALITLARSAATRQGPWATTSLALAETGYATNAAWLRDDARQVEYFQRFIQIAQTVDTVSPGTALSLIGVYELIDMDTHALLDPERHFGLLTSDHSRKPAFARISQFFAHL